VNAREIRKHIAMDDILEYCRRAKGGCWLWEASLHNDGYAAWNVGGRQIKVHRAAYLLDKGPIPKKHFIYHTCGNKHCCNPDHLECVNHKELFQRNAAEGHVARGERNGFSKLTPPISARSAHWPRPASTPTARSATSSAATRPTSPASSTATTGRTSSSSPALNQADQSSPRLCAATQSDRLAPRCLHG